MDASRIDPRQGGYSVPEILAVLMLIGILTTMAVPSMSGYVERTKTRRALDQLVGDITLARQLAVQRGGPVAVVLGTSTYTIDTLSSANSWGTAKTVDLSIDFAGASFVGAVSRVDFNSRGMLTVNADTGFVTVQVNASRDSALISGVGRVYRAY